LPFPGEFNTLYGPSQARQGAVFSDLGGCMLGGKIGLPELLILLAIVFFIFGAKRLPEIGKGIGEGIRNFKGAMKRGDKE
jgi:sec-independent protein translocase protein TatA